MYVNKYRDHLDDKNFYRQYLQQHGKPQYSDHIGGLNTILAVAGVLGGGRLAYESGMLKNTIAHAIRTLAKFQPGRMQAVAHAIRDIADDEAWKTGEHWVSRASKAFDNAPGHFQTHLVDYEMRMKGLAAHKSPLTNNPDPNMEMDLVRDISHRQEALSLLRKGKRTGEFDEHITADSLDKIMLQKLHDTHSLTEADQLRHIKETGHRYATVEDVWEHLNGNKRALISEAGRRAHRYGIVDDQHAFKKWKVDSNILIDEHGAVSDLREFRHAFGGFVDSFSNDFGIPMVHFNPMKLFYLDRLTTMKKPPLFTLISANTKQPIITQHNGYLRKPLLFSGGDIHDLSLPGLNKIAENTYLVSGRGGPVARLVRTMAQIPIKTFQRPTQGFFKKLRYDVGNILSLGFQDEPIRPYTDHISARSFDITSLNDIFSKAADFFNRKMPLVPKEANTWTGWLEDAYGTPGKPANWLIMQGYKPLEKSNSFKEYAAQFTAGLYKTGEMVDGQRVLNKNITTASLFGYGLFERLNAALNSMGLGLATRDMGSGLNIVKGLVFKRIVPLTVAIESLKYMDSISSVVMGEPFTQRFAEFYQDQSMVAAHMRDATGITEWAKSWAGVFPGGDQLADLPIIGHFLNLNKDEEEQKQYWEEGMDPVRKGRYWDLGNTPFTGGQVEYYRPNWVRRAKARVDFTDVKYGSDDEYWAHSWLPTPTHPLAPLRHFLTDPYWFEKKHYNDRPYLLTGGIDEISEFPIIGGALNATIGQILKPQKAMHKDWQTEQDQETQLTYGRHTVDSIIPAVVDPAAAQYFPSANGTSDILGVAAVPQGPRNANIAGIPDLPEGDTIAYTTSGGTAKVMQLAPGTSLRELNQLIKDKGIQRSGKTTAVRVPSADPDVAEDLMPPVDPMNPNGMAMMMGNLHYNMAEIGGFYGFASNMMTGESFDDRPVIAQSSRATSYERAFWDQDFGGIGGEANEIFRRFLPHRRRQIEEINPIRNTMPSWMPGSDYYTDFKHGDPYIKVKHGEERLPGAGYEALWGLKDPTRLSIGASYIGKSEEDIVSHLLKRDELDLDDAQDIMGYGERVHRRMQKDLTAKGVMIDYEQHVEDKVHAINGFYDGRVRESRFQDWAQANAVVMNDTGHVSQNDQAIIEMKTMSEKAFKSGEIRDYHEAQLNFYMGRTHTNRGYLIYMNRDNPDDTAHIYGYDFDPELYKKSLENVAKARATIRRMQVNGVIGPADTYDMVDRLRILADTAPYSNEYRSLRDQIGKMDLSDEDKKRVQTIRHQVAERKKFTRMTPYKFRTAEVTPETVTVTKVIPGRNYMFLTKEYPTNPIKLAGIEVPSAKDDPIAKQAHALIASRIKPGMKMEVLVSSDALTKVNNDTYQTISAVVQSGPLRNLNQELLRKGLAKEKETDDSPTGIYARYSPTQRAVGRMWELIAHRDTVFNTKWLQSRSPLESYERREVYGKDWQAWEHPVQGFLTPLARTMAHKGVVFGALEGAFFGLLMGRTGYGKLIGMGLGTAIGAGAGMYANVHRMMTGHTWVPKEREKEWAANEYLDTLTFVKDRRLFERYAEEAKKKEHFDVKKYIDINKAMGEKRKKEVRELQKLKRELKFAQNQGKADGIRRRMRDLVGYRGPAGPEDKELLQALNHKIYELINSRDIKKLGKYSAKALEYYSDSEKTMYGYEPGGPIENLLAALPKKDREYLLPFMEAPQQERKKIIEETPIYMRRALEASWGLPVEEKPDLASYFAHHELPDANWIGWDERVSMDDVKVKLVKREAMDQSEFDIWKDDVKRADSVHIPTPTIAYRDQDITRVRRQLLDVLGKSGLQDVNVEIEKTNHGKIDVDVDLQKDRRAEILAQLNNNGMSLFA